MCDPTRARVSARAVAVALVTLVLLLTAGGVPRADSAVPLRVQLTAVAATGSPPMLRVSGRVRPADPGARVVLQRRTHRWVTLARATLSRRGAFTFRVPVRAGTSRIRVRAVGAGGYGPGTSSVRTLRVHDPCPAMSAPPRLHAYFASPHGPSPSPITQAMSQLICSAAPGAHIDAAVLWIQDDPGDARRLLSALRWVSEHRRVRVRLVLDTHHYANRKGAPYWSAVRALADFADLRRCAHGCRTDGGRVGRMHDKFLLVDDTLWAPGDDPVLVSGTANWDTTQLAGEYESAVLVRSDPVLTREFAVRFESLRACASAARTTSRVAAGENCARWDATLARLGLDPDVYGLDRVTMRGGVAEGQRIWVDRWASAERPGLSGRGVSAVFSPQVDPRGRRGDVLADQLDGYHCGRGPDGKMHDLVRVASNGVTRAGLLDELAGLQDRGCRVSARVSATKDVDALRAHRIYDAACVYAQHDKFVVLDALDASGAPVHTVWVGAEPHFATSVLRDNTTLVITDRGVGTAAARALNRGVWQDFVGHYAQIAPDTTRCTRSGPGEDD